MPAGRPSDYTQELADKICSQLSEGISLRTVCLADDMPDKSTIFRWFREKPIFKDQYVQAKEESADAQHEDLAEIGNEAIIEAKTVNEKAANAVVSAYKLKADNLKWSMSKMKPKKYGDKLDLSNNGKDFPTPLLHVLRNNNGDEKNSKSDKEN